MFNWRELQVPFLSGEKHLLDRVVSREVYNRLVLLSVYNLNSKLNPKIFRWEHGQEAFAEFYIHWMEEARFEFDPGRGEFPGYFLGCLRNSCRQYRTKFFRDANRNEPLTDQALADFDQKVASALAHAPGEVREVIEAALQGRPKQQRRAFQLRYFEGFSQRETGERMGITASCVGVLCWRVRPAVVEALVKAGVIHDA